MRRGLSHKEAGKLGGVKTREIHAKKLKQRIDNYNLSPVVCNNCSQSLPYKKRHNKYCNRSCSASTNNRGLRRNKIQGEYCRVQKKCAFCQKEFAGRAKRKFCDKTCAAQHRRHVVWREIGRLEYSNSTPRVTKAYLIHKRGHKCEICNIVKWMDRPAPLVMDHIDGNASNNAVKNLRLVCGNCDMQLPTYKAKNTGNGRHWRKEKYKAGKSF